MRNKVRQKLEDGEVVLGMINFIDSPMVVEIMARAGIDFVVIDMEHSAIEPRHLAHVVRAADAAGIAPFVRIPEVDEGLVKRILNLGVQGIVLPHATKQSCERLLRAVRYAPDGDRGACPIVRATRYWPDDWDDYARTANREIMILPLIEDGEVLDDLAALVALPGISAVFLGPYDLSVSLGVPGAGFDHPKMTAALDRVMEQATGAGVHVFTTVGDRQERRYSQDLIARGIAGLIFATDGLVFLQACSRLVANVTPQLDG